MVDLTNPQSLNRYAYVMNNPTTRTDPSGLGPQQQTCGHGFVVPQGQNPATYCYNHMGIGEGSGPGAFFTNPFSVMDYFGISVVTDTFQAPQLLSTINFASLANGNGYATSVSIFTPGGFTSTYVGDALDFLTAAAPFPPMMNPQAVALQNAGKPPLRVTPPRPLTPAPRGDPTQDIVNEMLENQENTPNGKLLRLLEGLIDLGDATLRDFIFIVDPRGACAPQMAQDPNSICYSPQIY